MSGPRYDQAATREPSCCNKIPSSTSAYGKRRSASPRGFLRCSVLCIINLGGGTQCGHTLRSVQHQCSSPPFRRLEARRVQSAFRRVERSIADVTHIDLSQQWIGSSHPPQNCHCATHTRRTPKPTHATMRARIPERRQREQKRAPVPDQLPLVGWACSETGERQPLSEYQPTAYLDHRGRDSESGREHRRGKHENRNHQTDHASSPSEFR